MSSLLSLMGATKGNAMSQKIINPSHLVHTGGENWHVKLGQTTSPISVDDQSPFSIITRSDNATSWPQDEPVSDVSSISLESEGYEVGLIYQPNNCVSNKSVEVSIDPHDQNQSFRKKNLFNFKLYSVNGKVERLSLVDTDHRKCDEDSTDSPAGVDCLPSSIGQDNRVAPRDALFAPGVRTLEEKESSSVDQIFIDNESPCSVDLLRIPYDDSFLVESIDIEASSDPNVSPLSRWSSCLFDLADRIDDCCMGDVHILGILNSFDDSDVVVSAEEAEYRKLLRRKLEKEGTYDAEDKEPGNQHTSQG